MKGIPEFDWIEYRLFAAAIEVTASSKPCNSAVRWHVVVLERRLAAAYGRNAK
jgi:hypothetical protein